jgi:hypothetical protein
MAAVKPVFFEELRLAADFLARMENDTLVARQEIEKAIQHLLGCLGALSHASESCAALEKMPVYREEALRARATLTRLQEATALSKFMVCARPVSPLPSCERAHEMLDEAYRERGVQVMAGESEPPEESS